MTVGNALVMLLQNPDLLPSPSQKFAAVLLLLELYKHDPQNLHPFASAFVHLLTSDDQLTNNKKTNDFPCYIPKLSTSEKNYISHLITGPQKDMYKKTLRQILNSDSSTLPLADVTSLQLGVTERFSEFTPTVKSRIPVVFPYPEIRPLGLDAPTLPESNTIKKTSEALLTGSNAPVQQTTGPEFLRLAPPLFCGDEIVWLDPVGESDHVIAYDGTVCIPRGAGSEARRLISQAFTGSLTLLQQSRLLSELERDSRLVYHIGITPNKVFYYMINFILL